jgi:uncharacterized protein (TIGR01777 family)
MRIAISGSSGLIGNELKSQLDSTGHEVTLLVRHPTDDPNCIAPWESEAEAGKLSGFDAVIHLSGKPIADRRWTDGNKSQIRSSRVGPTRDLCDSLVALPDPPPVLICASAIGIYGNRGDEVLEEQSEPGGDFLSDVVQQWEAACQPAIDVGIRVVNARFGIVLDPSRGALKQMLVPAKLFAGALGSGQQWWSWIAIDDAVGAIIHVIKDDSISGRVNFVSPEPIRNRDFAKSLGKALGRPAIFPAPAFVLRLALGETADALLLSSTRVKPTKLLKAGYRYKFTDLDKYLKNALGKA